MSEIEELIAHLETQKTTPTVDRLISKVKEQGQTIERLKLIIESDRKTWSAELYNDGVVWQAVAEFCKTKKGCMNLSDKLEGFSAGWLAARTALAEAKEK